MPRVPPSVGYPLFAMLGDLAWRVAPAERRRLERNLGWILRLRGEEHKLDASVRAAFRNLLWGYYELFRLPTTPPEKVREAGRFEGLHHLDAARGARSGSIVVFAHVGNLEVICQAALLRPDQRFAVVIEGMPDEHVHALFRRLRSSQGIETVRADRPLSLVRRFREGANLVICGDLTTTSSGMVVDVFGRPALVPYGAAKLALRYSAPLMVVAGWRESIRTPDRFHVRLSEPLELSGDANDRQEVCRAVTRVVAHLENVIDAQPWQWLAFRDVWEEAA